MSRYQEALRDLAMIEDSEERLTRAAEIDNEVGELDDRFDTREEYNTAIAERDRVQAELDAAIVERDEWRTRYANRFFDSGEGVKTASEIIDAHNADIKKESRPRGYAALWADKTN